MKPLPIVLWAAFATILAASVATAMLWASIGSGDGDDDNDFGGSYYINVRTKGGNASSLYIIRCKLAVGNM